jgi:histidinol dehydrogenase
MIQGIIQRETGPAMPMKILTTAQAKNEILALLNRRPKFSTTDQVELGLKVAAIIQAVQKDGDRALIDFTARFDQVQLTIDSLAVAPDEFEQAKQTAGADFLAAIRQAKANITAFHQKQLPKDWLDLKEDGIILGQRYQAVDSAGLYVPGGTAGSTPLVSSVLMNALPAVVAGVKRVVTCTPPNRDGKVNSFLLLAALECGVAEIYKVGGAQAIAAMAYGTSSIVPVDMICGPGNQYVTEAKRQVFGYVGLDLLAGPSEILIIADSDNDPDFVAADLLSQAEHGPNNEAGAFLLTLSQEFADSVASAVVRQLTQLPRNQIARASLSASGCIIVTNSLTEAFELANFAAPEHLELLLAEPWNHISKIKHAGAIFIGPYSPEPIGDYVAGTNHVLPTNGTARFASGLNIDHFLKKTSLIAYNRTGIAKYCPAAITLAGVEGLDAHAKAVQLRLQGLIQN